MKVQEVILPAMAGKLNWREAAEIIGVTDRTMRRWWDNYEEFGYDGLLHRQCGKPSPKRIPRPLPGMLLHMDGSTHAWFQDERWYDLIVILDDATSEIYYAQLVEEEGTRSVMAGLREVIEKRGIFCALYSDRGSQFFVNPKAGEPVDRARLTQVGQALRELGIQMIPAYSPQARGRMERSYRTWQGRLPQELRIHGLKSKEAANAFLRTEYIGEFNRRFAVPAEGKGNAFVKTRRRDLDLIFSIQHPRTVNQDNTVTVDNRVFQIEKTRWRNTLAGCSVVVHEHLDSLCARDSAA